MRWFEFEKQFDFIGHRRKAFLLSGVLLLISVVSLAVQGLNLGIDFTGGYLIEVGFEKPVDLQPVREAMNEAGFQEAQIQHVGAPSDVLLRVAPRAETSGAKVSDQVLGLLRDQFDQSVTARRVEFVGPQVGSELRDEGGFALLLSLLLILIYVAFRFEKRFALGSVLALIHDVLIVVGMFSLLQIQFDLPVVGALLAVLGYSINDTIVVFDRIRELFRRQRRGTPAEITNRAINETLSRTLMTSTTTLLVLLALLFLGGPAVLDFALSLTIGVLVGTYSSTFVASTLLLETGLSREDMMPVQKEGAEGSQP